MSDEPDDFDFLTSIGIEPGDGEEQHVGMIRGVRCKDSSESEERERRYLESLLSTDLDTAALPIPFFSEGADVCDPPTPGDAKNMMKKFGITVEEYQELMSHDRT
jgi:hypothetical protein